MDETETISEEERTELTSIPGATWRILGILIIVSVGLAIGYFAWKATSKQKEVVATVLPQSTPDDIVVQAFQTEATAVPTPLSVVTPQAASKPISPATKVKATVVVAAPPKPDKALEALRKEYLKFTPSAFASLRGKLAEELKKGDREDLGMMLADVHSYLGERQNRKEWIEYAYTVAYKYHSRRPNDARATRSLAWAYLAARQFEKAQDSAQEALTFLPNDPMAHNLLGQALNRGAVAAKGMTTLERAHERWPHSYFVTEALLRASLHQKAYKKAEKLGHELLKLEPQDLVVADLLSTAYENEAKWGEVVLVYEPIAEQLKNRWEPQYSLARAYRQTKQFDRASQMLDMLMLNKMKSMDSEDQARVTFERGKVEFDQDKLSMAVPYFREAFRLDPNLSFASHYLAGALYRLRKFPESALIYGSLAIQEPKNAEVKRNLGMALLEKGDAKEAEKAFQELVAMGEEDASLYYHLARCKEALGDSSGAMAYLDRALSLDPNYKNAQTHLKNLQNRTQK